MKIERMLRVKQVAERTALSVSTIWRYVKLNKFPRPYKLGKKVTVWEVSEIDTWLNIKKEVSCV